MRNRKTTTLIIGIALSIVLAVALAGYVGFTESIGVLVSPPPDSLAASVVPLPAPEHDAKKPTVAILLGNTLSEPTDVLGAYAIFAESGLYNVYAVASSRTVRTLTGGLDVVPQLSFDELSARVPGGPDIVVVPQIVDIRSPRNSPVLDWLKQQGRGRALLFSWCTGAEVLAESGLIDGKSATAHWGDIDRLERNYPKVHWQRGVRYVDGGTLLSSGGLTAGVDATLHLLIRRHGTALAEKVSEALRIPPSPFVANPSSRQYRLAPSDSIFLWNAAFTWPKRRAGVLLYDGVGELDLASVADVYAASSTHRLYTLASTTSVVSRRGLQFVPRSQTSAPPALDRLLIPGGEGGERTALHLPSELRGVPFTLLRSDRSTDFAYRAALLDLASWQDVWTAAFATKRLEIRTPLDLKGQPWPLRMTLVPLGITFLILTFLFRMRRSAQPQLPPVALGAIVASLMWCASMAAPALAFRLSSNVLVSLSFVLLGGVTCLAAVASFRRAKTTVNPMRPDSTSSLVISGIYRYTRNPMYLGFLLILLGWAAFLSNPLAVIWIPAFVVYLNHYQIGPEERALGSLFAKEYSAYQTKVRRWV